MEQIVVITEAHHFRQVYINFIDILLSRLTPYAIELLGIISVGFDAASQY